MVESVIRKISLLCLGMEGRLLGGNRDGGPSTRYQGWGQTQSHRISVDFSS